VIQNSEWCAIDAACRAGGMGTMLKPELLSQPPAWPYSYAILAALLARSTKHTLVCVLVVLVLKIAPSTKDMREPTTGIVHTRILLVLVCTTSTLLRTERGGA
jgi:hypothetical protein